MKIRKIKKSDLKQCSKLLEEAYSKEPYNENFGKGNALKYINSKYKSCKEDSFVLDIDGKVIGFVFSNLSYWANGPQAIMEEIVIDKDFRGKGYSQKLNNRLENYLRKKGVKSVILWVKKKSSAYKFHIKNGYKDGKEISFMFKELR